MRAKNKWQDYSLLDATDGYRLENWGGIILARPDPQIVWKFDKKSKQWDDLHAIYHRSQKGGGSWEYKKNFKEQWVISYDDLKFKVSPTGFKHTGLFPEQATNWDEYIKLIKTQKEPVNVLNLFSYTGGASLACAKAGAKVCHVDASKGMVQWAKENAKLSNLENAPIRWIVDDCVKFVKREIKRGNKYDAIIMDPPSYGRGPDGEVWKLEDNIYDLIKLCKEVLSDTPLFFTVNSYTTGIAPSSIEYMLSEIIQKEYKGSISCDEIGLVVNSTNNALACGSTAFWKREGL